MRFVGGKLQKANQFARVSIEPVICYLYFSRLNNPRFFSAVPGPSVQ